MTTGWMIGVLLEIEGERAPARHFYAVVQADPARAEWACVDLALRAGVVAASPSGGMEPVEAISPLSAATIRAMGLGEGEVRALGRRWPRRWIGGERPAA